MSPVAGVLLSARRRRGTADCTGYGIRDEEVCECENARVRELEICLNWFGSIDYLDYIDSLDNEGYIQDTG